MALLALSVAYAQDQPDLKKLAELGQPGPMHKVLDKEAGDWTVDVIYKFGDSPEQKGTAACHAEWIFDGHYLRKTYTSRMGGQPFTVEQTLGYDNFRKEFFEFQIESDNTERLETAGELTEDGKTINCAGLGVDPVSLKPCQIRTVTTLIDADTYTVEWFMKIGDKPQTKQVTLLHKRKK